MAADVAFDGVSAIGRERLAARCGLKFLFGGVRQGRQLIQAFKLRWVSQRACVDRTRCGPSTSASRLLSLLELQRGERIAIQVRGASRSFARGWRSVIDVAASSSSGGRRLPSTICNAALPMR